ncbi:MAG: tetratricopeptide repeat protein [Phycisphaerales bacterium]|nr:MAG: tetratricopeptide repeat protein [Phycisphaerales bacterium]
MAITTRRWLCRGMWLIVLGLFVLPLVAEPRFPNQDAEEAARRGDAHAAKGEWATALVEYRNAVALDPGNVDYRARLGAALGEEGKSNDALLEFLEGLRLDPASSLTYRSLGDYYLGLRQWYAADASYRKAVELSAGDAKAHHGLGLALTAQEEFDEAAAAFSEAARLEPVNPEHCFWLGEAQCRQKKWTEAEVNIRLALEKSPETGFKVRCVNALGDLFFAQERWTDAEREFRKATSLDPKDGRSLANLAAALHRRGAREKAWQTAHRALSLGFEGPHRVYTELGIDPQPVVPLVPVIRESRGAHPSDSDLLAAVRSEDAAGVRAALVEGANPEAREDGKRAIEIAADAGDASTIEALFDYGASGNAAPSGGEAPLIHAVRSKRPDTVAALLNAGVDTECGPEGSALLAATEGLPDALSVEIVEALVQAGAQVNVRHKDTGLTPLMWAVQSNSNSLPKLLIEAGADAGAQDLTRQTAIDYARSAGNDDTTRLLVACGSSAAPEAPGSAIRLAPGGDLLEASRGASSGQTIVLSAGEYSGPIDVREKTLTIIGDSERGSVIVDHRGGQPRLLRGGDPYVFVGEGGNLALWNVRFDRPPAGGDAVLLQDGAVLRLGACVFENQAGVACAALNASLFVSRCRFENLTGPVAITLNESTGIVRDTQFRNLNNIGVQAANGSNLSAVGSVFTGAQMGVAGFDRSILRIAHCEFTNVGRGVQGVETGLVSVRDSEFAEGSLAFVENGARTVLRRNTVRNARIDPESDAIYVQNSRNLLIADNRIDGVESAIIVRDSAGQPVALSRNTIRRAHRAIGVVGQSEGDRPLALITGNRLLGSSYSSEGGRWGVLLDGEMHAVLSENTILQTSGAAVCLQAKANARFVGNLLSTINDAIRFVETSARKSTLTREFIDGAVTTSQFGSRPVRRSGTDKLETFVQWSPHAERLKHVIRAKPGSADPPAVDLREFLSAVETERNAALAEASEYGTVRLEVWDRLGRRGMLPFTVYDRQSPPRGSTSFTLDQVVDAKRLVRKWKEEDLDSIEDPIEQLVERSDSSDDLLIYIRSNAHPATRKLVAAYDAGSEPSELLVLSIIAELNRFLDSEEFVDDANNNKDRDMAALIGCWSDWQRVHEKGLTPEEKKRRARVFNRKLLEHAFRFGIAQPEPIVVARPSQALPAGAYVLETDSDTGISTEVAFGPALDAIARVIVNDGLWVTYDGKTRELLRLRPRYEMQRAIGRLRFEWHRPGFAMRRADADSATVAHAIDLARGKLSGSEGTRSDPYFWLPMRIFSAVGETGDTERILEASRQAAGSANPWTFQEKLGWAAVIGRIDAAHGQLAGGSLAALLEDSDRDWSVAAAIELHRNGLRLGDELLRDELAHGEGFARCPPAALALLDSVDPRTLEAMRALWDRIIHAEGLELAGEAERNPSLAPVLYLLTFGDSDDWDRVSRFSLSDEHVRYLTFLARNPAELWRKAAQELGIGFRDSEPFYRLGESLLDRTRGEVRQLLSDFDRESSSAVFENAPRTPADSPYNTSRIYMAPFWPNRMAAACYARIGRWEPLTTPHSRLTWWKSKEFVPVYVTRWLRGSQGYLDHLSYFSPEEIAQEVEKQGQGEKPGDYDLYMSCIRVATREHTHSYMRSTGFESRPYLARHGTDSGLSGVADLRFNWKGDTLEIGVRITQDRVISGGLMADPESRRAHYPYILERGRKMIQSVTLRRGDLKIQAGATEKADDDLFFLFEGTPGTRDLSGWYLDVKMKYVDQEFTLTAPLFFGENARRLRMISALSAGEEGQSS